MGLVELLPQVPPAAVFHEGHVAGHVQAQEPGARFAGRCFITGLARGLRKLIQQACWQSLHLGGLRQAQGPVVGGIEDVVAEACRELRQGLTGGVEGLFDSAAQANAPQLHVPQLGIEDPLLGPVQLGASLLQLLEGAIDDLALTGAVAELHDSGLLAGMSVTELWAIADPVEMTDDAPTPAQAFAESLERIDHRVPIQGLPLIQLLAELGLEGSQLILQGVHQARDVFADRFWRDRFELR